MTAKASRASLAGTWTISFHALNTKRLRAAYATLGFDVPMARRRASRPTSMTDASDFSDAF